MPTNKRLIFALFFIIFATVCPQADATPAFQHVILVSVDGLMPESYTRADEHGLKIPTLRHLMQEGAYSQGLAPVMPTVTYPSHTSMVTGVNPGVHGIVTNAAWDPQDKTNGDWRWFAEDIKVPTLWDAATQANLSVALVGWPVTVGARADVVVPEFWRQPRVPPEYEPDDLKLMRALSPSGILSATAGEFKDFYPKFSGIGDKDEALTDIAITALKTRKPNLLLLHLVQVDHEQHVTGLWTPEAKAAIENADAQIQRLLDAVQEIGIAPETVLMVVSDHGFASVSKQVRPGVLLREKGLVALDAQGHVVGWKAVVIANGGSAYIYVKDPADAETRQTLLDTFAPMAGEPGSGIHRVLTSNLIAELGGDSQAFLALEAAHGFMFTGGYGGAKGGTSPEAGVHGYFPDDPAMRPALLVYGPSIRHGVVKNGHLIDIGPTIAAWLGLKLDKAQGRPLKLP